MKNQAHTEYLTYKKIYKKKKLTLTFYVWAPLQIALTRHSSRSICLWLIAKMAVVAQYSPNIMHFVFCLCLVVISSPRGMRDLW